MLSRATATGRRQGEPCERPPVAAKPLPMSSKDWIGYPKLVEQAQREMDRVQRNIVREALLHVTKGGIMGNHHFYITYDTRHPGVVLSDAMKARYPEQITIVLQNQFWNLKVHEHSFEVGLSFNKVPETLHIPFEALVQFSDPSQSFGIRFEPLPPSAHAEPARKAQPTPEPEPQAPSAQAAPDTAEKPEPDPAPSSGPTVVSLDKFRKK